ncbi:pentatricopeptide repeat-containing protein [Senna tora]|uniref:Probable RNA-binding protein 18 n=1 Tax=Senna tora TaxID=362788 RepID=A0A834W8K4_9FABA|nr:pentatricopeptide repeat-containing protein [Senna tora]
MSSLSKLKKLFGSPQGFGVCHKRNRGASRETKWVSLPCTENSLDQSVGNLSFEIDTSTTPKQPNHSMGSRFCVLVALKAESFSGRESLNLVGDTIHRNNWFSLYSEALEQLRKSGILLSSDAFRVLMRTYTSLDGFFRARRYHEAYSWYAKMFKVGVMPNVVLYAVIMRGLSEEGRVGEAVKLLDEMAYRGIAPSVYCYNAVIKGFCDIGLLDRARSLQLEISKNDQFPDACTYNILMSGMCRDGRVGGVGEAQKIFNNMEKLGCFPSVATFNALINELCKAGQLEEAFLLFCKMETGKSPLLFLRVSQGGNRVTDSVSLQKTVEKMCEEGQLLNAYKLLIDCGLLPNITTYTILINGYCKAGNIDRALKLFEHLKLKGLSPDSVTYGTLIDGLFRADRDEDAIKFFDHMLEKGCEPSCKVYKTLMIWFCRKNKVSLAFRIWLKYLNNIPGRVDDSINFLEKHFDSGHVEIAFRRLLELDLKFKDFDLAPYTILIMGLCRAERAKNALNVFYLLDEFNISINPTGCVHLIRGLCNERNLDKAVEVFHYALDKGFNLGIPIRDQLLVCLLRSRMKKEYALDLIKRMKPLGHTLLSYQSPEVGFLLRRYWKQQKKYCKCRAAYNRGEVRPTKNNHGKACQRSQVSKETSLLHLVKDPNAYVDDKKKGRLAYGRPLVVRLANEKCLLETADNSLKAVGEGNKMHLPGMTFDGMEKEDPNAYVDDKSESRLYIGNLDLRITEATLIKMFSPFGKIVSEDFLLHTRGPKSGEPRGFAFIQYSSKEEAELAKEKMHGRLACGRPLVVRLASEKYLFETADNLGEGKKMHLSGGGLGQTSRSAKIAAIKSKLKSLEEESSRPKKQKLTDDIS